MSGERYDAVVLGAGPAGEVATGIPADAGLNVALVERELVGGECGYWACIPSKTLLRPPEARHESSRTAGVSTPELDWARVAAYRDWMTRHLDDSGAVSGYEEQSVTVFKSTGKLAGPGRVEVDATGSEPQIPPIDGLAKAGYWTNREATTLKEIPKSAVFIGGGGGGVQRPDRLLDREDPEVSRLIQGELDCEGIRLALGRRATRVRLDGTERVVELDDGSEISGEALVVSADRRPRLQDLGLDTVGIDASARGIPVDERCRAAEGVWGIGDVTGVSLFTEVTLDLPNTIARPYTYAGNPRGWFGLVVDHQRDLLVGAWAVAPLAGEWTHQAVLAIRAEVPIGVLKDTIAQFPTFSEAYVSALRSLPGEQRR